jgi:hypothetical protein
LTNLTTGSDGIPVAVVGLFATVLGTVLQYVGGFLG